MPLTKEEQSILLQLARNTINAFLAGKHLPPLPKAIGALGERSGAFVTLHKRGMLRGCIGNMIGHGPLVHIVQEMAIAAATQDPRFSSVSPSEMGEIDIEISVLSPMKKIRDVSEIQVGVHGIMISKGFCHGVLLPQVATEQKWDRETFLIHTCYKAGLPPDAWKDPKTTIEIFSAQVFGEGRAHGRP
ncbi:MAG: AmmeMemoRadiSam system protein A [Deltaproteobacteria bacterium]|nr:AmmeMemoRadiSam system protein A [Deltaproteobacteria bacterium]